MAELIDEVVDSSVGFLYKTMLERDPQKRRVKPVQKHLIQLNFGGLEDSSDDSDFEMPAHAGSDMSDVDIVSGTDGESAAESESDSGSEQGESGDDESDGQLEKDDEGLSLGELIQKSKLKVHDLSLKTGSEDTTGSSSSRLKVTICCVCLGDNSEEDDEIVECDGCGVSVHEGCYGVAESQSVASTESSASTEPWFCDACKAGVKAHCELCPNSGGIFKETDAGRWAHIVCALYIPGVAFGDVDRLSPVTLFEMPHTKWGAKECSLCEDERFSRTGVCISCDAGMCRTYFHVTCAQREGLLSEASPDEEIADPFYAYCKQHGDKFTVRAKRRNYLAIRSHSRTHTTLDLDEKEQVRVERKLNRHRQKYQIARQQRAPSWGQNSGHSQILRSESLRAKRRRLLMPPKQAQPVPTGVPKEKIPRLLTTNPSATRRLMRKAELLGINTQPPAGAKGDIRKKWHVAPALNVGFVSYYLDRNVRINNMKTHQRELLVQGNKLSEQQAEKRTKYDEVLKDVEGRRQMNKLLRQEGEDLWKMLGEILGKPLPLPEILKPVKVVRSTSRKDTPRSPPGIIHQCGLCKKTTDQHLLAKCDMCHLFYHLGCLDPPLTRMPKKTKQQGWQCSECGSSSGEDSKKEKNQSANAPRRLREKIKEPMKFTPIGEKMGKVKRERVRSKGRRKARAPKRPREALISHRIGEADSVEGIPSENVLTHGVSSTDGVEEDLDREMPILKKERPCRLPKPKQKDVRTDCCVCLQEGDNSNLVRCDECKLCYHFHCLDPPLKKSPKQRGYAWHCTACDPTEGEPVTPAAKDVKRKRRDLVELPKSEPAVLPPPPPPQEPVPPIEDPPKQSDVDEEEEEGMEADCEENDDSKNKDDSLEITSSTCGDPPPGCLSDSDVMPMEEDAPPPELQKEN